MVHTVAVGECRMSNTLLPRWRALLVVVAILVLAPPPMAKADGPIKLVFSGGAAPLAFEEDGLARGIEIDVAREVFSTRLGLPIDVAIYPWERAQQMVRSGAADGFITIATAERQTYASCGRIPVLRAAMRPLLRRNDSKREEIESARSLSDLRGFSIVSYLGNGWARHNLQGFDVFEATDFPASLRGLAQGRGDLAVVSAFSALYYLDKLKLKEELVMVPIAVDTVDYVLCFGNKSPHAELLPEFERVLDVLRGDGGYQHIIEAYGLTAELPY